MVGPIALTISHVTLEADRTKQSQNHFNTAHFVERELRPGEPLKPMVLNATNSSTMRKLTGSPFIEDWQNVRVTIYVDPNVRFGKDITEGLRINPKPPTISAITPANKKAWDNAKAAYRRDGNLDAVLARASMSDVDQQQLIKECADALA